jgi:RNA polymerase-binding transcription factor DksA
LLVNLSQAVEELALRKAPSTHVEALKGALDGNVKVQFFDVSRSEFGHFENISNALIRLDKGTYGRCTGCGKRIERNVLVETPLATLCLECWEQESQP